LQDQLGRLGRDREHAQPDDLLLLVEVISTGQRNGASQGD